MQFSGKITNSVLAYLARFGLDQERLFELTEIPLEFLRDPTSWINASDVEAFLRAIEKEYHVVAPNLLNEAGHAGAEVRAWGVLDSVLRMMKKPLDIFSQPHRFISYFVSPAPPIVNLQITDDSVSFDLPISPQEYPYTVAYLTAALEGLPKYWGQENAYVRWRHTNVRMSWSEAQPELLEEQAANHRPELVENLVRGVEMAQAQVESRDLEIARLEQEVRELKSRLSRAKAESVPPPATLADGERGRLKLELDEVRENVLRLADYLTRSQQALTLARTAHRQDPQVQTVLRRIDWETIRSQYPWLNLQIMEGLNTVDDILNARGTGRAAAARPGKVHMRDILDGVVARMEQSDTGEFKVRPKSFINDAVAIDPDRAHAAIWQIVSASAQEMRYQGEIEILARREGAYVEVVVGEKGGASDVSEELPLFRGQVDSGHVGRATAEEMIEQFDGEFEKLGENVGERQFICRWPVQDL